MKKRFHSKEFVLFVSSLLFLRLTQALGAQADVEILSGEAYGPGVLERLGQARSSIVVSMYRMQGSEGTSARLLEALALAHGRGIQVKVYLDREGEAGGFNQAAAAQLEGWGIPVYWDPPDRMLHLKAVLVDGEWAILGSHNWTDQALSRNVESSVSIHSKERVQEVLTYLEKQPWQKGPLPLPQEDAVPFERSFLTDPKLFGRMVQTRSEGALDLWLWLGSHIRSGEIFRFDYELASHGLGLDGRPDRVAYRRRLNRLLKKLEGYGLVDFDPQFGQDALVRLKRPDPTQGSFGFPKDYWRFRWWEELSFTGKGCFLIALAKQQDRAGSRAFWEITQKRLAGEFNVSFWFIQKGMAELSRKGIVEIRYRMLSRRGPIRTPARYRLRGLYDRQANARALRDLEAHHGQARFQKARRWAAAVFKDHNPVALRLLLEEVPLDGEPIMEKALRLVSSKSPTNPKRQLGYLIQTYRRLAEEEKETTARSRRLM